MMNSSLRLAALGVLVSVAVVAPAQRLHGLAIDLGKTNPVDSTRITNLSIGVTSHTDSLKGVQLNVLSNYAWNVKGLQLSGFSNISSTPLRGMQLSGITNITMGVEKGLQLASLLNVSAGTMSGMQLGAYNYTNELNGLQLGAINVATSHPKGWQVGIINYTKDTSGRKIGLVNVNPSTTVDFMVYGGTSTKINGAVRFRNPAPIA